ncbi:MAG: hypothetical protein ACOYOA_03595 [Saprospiraceae bacterium]
MYITQVFLWWERINVWLILQISFYWEKHTWQMDLFPYILVRMAGLPFDVLEKYNNNPNIGQLYRYLQEDIQHPVLQKGMLFSSMDFSSNLYKFVNKEPENFRKKEFRKAITALKYLSRCATKSSPFADFCTVGLLDMHKVHGFQSKSELQINLIFLEFFSAFILQHKVLRAAVDVRVNPSLRRVPSEWSWIMNSDNEEQLQKAAPNELLTLLDEFLTVPNCFYKVEAYLKQFCEKDDDVASFLNRLIDVQFIVVDFPFFKNQAGFFQLQHWLNLHEQEKSVESDFLDWLLAIRKNNQLFSEDLLFYNSIWKAKLALPIRMERVFYKNVAHDTSAELEFVQRVYPQLHNCASIYAKIAALIEPLHIDALRLRTSVFLDQSDVFPIALNALYEGVFHSEENGHALLAAQIGKLRADFETWLGENLKFQSDSLHLDLDTLAKADLWMEQATNIIKRSISTSVNLILQASESGIMVYAGASPGYGKQFLRFLSLFQDNLDFKVFALADTSDLTHLEINDASFHTANEHFPIATFELDTPASLGKQELLAVNDIFVEKSKDGLYILKSQPTGMTLLPLDLGLEHPSTRSPLYQLLATFAPRLPTMQLFLNLLNNAFEKQFPHESAYPRISIADQLVLQRKHWYLDVKDIPGKSDQLASWAKKQKLPLQFFVRIPEVENGQESMKRRLSSDDYKPQFIDLRNALLSILFVKIASRAPEVLLIEELLPPSEEIPKIGTERRVMELVIQFETNT